VAGARWAGGGAVPVAGARWAGGGAVAVAGTRAVAGETIDKRQETWNRGDIAKRDK